MRTGICCGGRRNLPCKPVCWRYGLAAIHEGFFAAVKLMEHASDGELRDAIGRAKLRLLRMHYEAGVGHIGGNLSVLDIMMSMYDRVIMEGDEFILSKGHAAGAWYVTLWSKGLLGEEDLV